MEQASDPGAYCHAIFAANRFPLSIIFAVVKNHEEERMEETHMHVDIELIVSLRGCGFQHFKVFEKHLKELHGDKCIIFEIIPKNDLVRETFETWGYELTDYGRLRYRTDGKAVPLWESRQPRISVTSLDSDESTDC